MVEAEAELRRSISLEPQYVEGHLGLVSFLIRLGKFDHAKDQYAALPHELPAAAEKSLYPISEQAEAHWNFAIEASKADGAEDVAVRAFRHAIVVNPRRYRSEVRPSHPKAEQLWRIACRY